MRYISTRLHGLGDYLLGSLLILVTWLEVTGSNEGAIMTSLVFGGALMLNSLLTDFELGAVDLFTMPFHLWIDLMAGLHLAAAPWFFNFSGSTYLPHLLTGVAVMIGGLLTSSRPSYRPSRAHQEDTSRTRSTAIRAYGNGKNPDIAIPRDLGVSSQHSPEQTS